MNGHTGTAADARQIRGTLAALDTVDGSTGRRVIAGFIADEIAAEFPDYAVTVHPNWGGIAFHAVRSAPAAGGVFAIVTSDEAELRTALADGTQ